MSRLAPLFLCLLPWGAAAQDGDAEYAVGRLELEAAWRLDPPEGRFDASGIERSPEGDLLVVRDAELAIYGIRFSPDSDVARLYRHPGYRLPDPLPDLGSRRFDVEGLAFDGEGTLYISDEYERRVLRIPSAGRIETLDLDLSQARRHFSPRDRNASLEGIAMGGGRLFLANERSKGRLFEFDPATGKMLHSFLCKPRENLWPDPHYSGLDWHDGKLYVLMRDAWLVVEMDPDKRTILRVPALPGRRAFGGEPLPRLLPACGIDGGDPGGGGHRLAAHRQQRTAQAGGAGGHPSHPVPLPHALRGRGRRAMSWERFRQWSLEIPSLDILLDFSRLRMEQEDKEALRPAIRRALGEMEALEKGGIANPDENRMVGHYWLRDAQRAPDPAIAEAIGSSIAAVEDFAGRVHGGRLKGEGGGFQHALVVGIGGLGPRTAVPLPGPGNHGAPPPFPGQHRSRRNRRHAPGSGRGAGPDPGPGYLQVGRDRRDSKRDARSQGRLLPPGPGLRPAMPWRPLGRGAGWIAWPGIRDGCSASACGTGSGAAPA